MTSVLFHTIQYKVLPVLFIFAGQSSTTLAVFPGKQDDIISTFTVNLLSKGVSR